MYLIYQEIYKFDDQLIELCDVPRIDRINLPELNLKLKIF